MPGLRLRLTLVVFCLALAASTSARAQAVDAFNPGANSGITALAVQPDGKILVGGDFSFSMLGGGGTGTTTRRKIGRLNADGTLDVAFNPGVNGIGVTALALQTDGKILVGGFFSGIGGGTGTTPRNHIARLNADGTVDAAFNPGTDGFVATIVVQADGKILVGGAFTMLGGGGTGTNPRSNIGRLNADGSIDALFNPGAGSLEESERVNTIAIQPNGQILVGGTFMTFGGGGAGTTTHLRMGRLNSDGSLDAAFTMGADFDVTVLTVQPDGKILVAGAFTALGPGLGSIGGGEPGTFLRRSLGRLNADASGSVDATFDPGTSPGEVDAMAVQANGKILVGGSFFGLGGGTGTTVRNRIGRLLADGTVDATFNPGANGFVEGLALQPDGAVVVSGLFSGLGGGTGTTTRNRIGRLTNGDAAVQSLAVTAGGTVATWSRSGAAPEAWRTTLESSTDGVTYTAPLAGARVAGGWQWTGLSLPTGNQNLRLRVRAFYGTGASHQSGSIVEVLSAISGTNVIENNAFSDGTTGWTPFSPSPGGIVSNVTAGVFQFFRPAGSTEAEIIQSTGLPLPAGAAVEATFDLGNTDSVRKRFKVLIHDLDFSDSLSCTFFLDANAPLRTFTMRMHSTRAWVNASITFYASTVGSGGFYQVDNVSLQYVPSGAIDKTECVDPLAPAAPGGVAGPTLLTNGDFASGALLPGWGTDGPIVQQITAGVLQFLRGAGAPAPVVLQQTGQAMNNDDILTATLQLGNSSAVRKRVKVLVHDVDFTDSPSCIFWLAPGQALQTYTMRVYATKAWANATISVYPSTSGADQWTLLDNVTLARTPGSATVGTNCFEPGSVPREAAPAPDAPAATVPGWTHTPEAPADLPTSDPDLDPAFDWPSSSVGDFVRSPDATWTETGTGWEAVATSTEPAILRRVEPLDLRDATSATLTFQSWLATTSSRAEVQVSVNGVDWFTVSVVPASATWVPIEVDLHNFLGEVLEVQFVFYGVVPADLKVGGSVYDLDVWRIDEIRVND